MLTCGPDVTEKEKKLDSRCTVSLGFRLCSVDDSEQELDSPWALFQDSDGSGEDVKPFLPRFLLQETIFAHCPFDDLYPEPAAG